MNSKKTATVTIFMFFSCLRTLAQSDSVLLSEWSSILQLDTVTISAPGTKFNIPAFMKLVLEDKSLHQSFRNLHTTSYTARHNIVEKDKKGKVREYFTANTFQELKYGCRSIKFITRNHSSGFFDKAGKDKYYTTKIYSRMFLSTETICNQGGDNSGQHAQGLIGTYTEKIKSMVFRPAQKTFLPFIGDQNTIFTKKHRNKYSFKLSRVTYQGLDAYLFNIRRRNSVPDEEILIESMDTWFDASDLQILRRVMVIRKPALLYDIDISIDVGTRKIDGNYLPVYMKYTGNWHVPMKKRERISFLTELSY